MKDEVDKLIEECKIIEKNRGYYFHIHPDAEFPNVHTHGLLRNFGVIELQVGIFNGNSEWSSNLIDFIVQKIIKKDIYPINDGVVYGVQGAGYLQFKLLKDEYGMPIYRLLVGDIKDIEINEKEFENQFTEEDRINNKNMIEY